MISQRFIETTMKEDVMDRFSISQPTKARVVFGMLQTKKIVNRQNFVERGRPHVNGNF